MKITKDNIWEEASKGNLDVLKSPLFDTLKTPEGGTILHALAVHFYFNKGSKKLLKEVFQHHIRITGFKLLYARDKKVLKEVLQHPLIDKLKDYDGWTPLHFLVDSNMVTKKWMKNKYPWYNGIEELTPELLTKLLNSSNIEKFIFESNK